MTAPSDSPPNGDPRWYVHIGGKALGPYGRSDVAWMIQNHQVRARDHLFPEGGAGWIEARNDPTFGKLFSEPPLGLAQFKVPWLTLSILVVLIVIFLLENASDPSALTPSVATLVAFGALSHKLVFSDGEWFRLFTAPLLHANFPHILGNGVALVLGGWILERLVGRLWFFAFFTVGALGGSLVSAAVNPVNQVSVGASGALMGMFAALFVSAFRFPFGTAARTSLVLNSLRILVPSLLPFFPAAGGGRINYGAHVGGMLSGGIMALLLLMCWPEGARIPQLRPVAAAVSALGVLLFVTSGGLAIARHQQSVQSFQPKDVLEDHGPKRAACDFQWGKLNLHDPGLYRRFLQKCMYENSGNP